MQFESQALQSWRHPSLTTPVQVALDSLPSIVKDGLQAKAGTGKILKVESLAKHDQLVAYEAKVQTDGKKKEIQVGPDDQPLAHEE